MFMPAWKVARREVRIPQAVRLFRGRKLLASWRRAPARLAPNRCFPVCGRPEECIAAAPVKRSERGRDGRKLRPV